MSDGEPKSSGQGQWSYSTLIAELEQLRAELAAAQNEVSELQQRELEYATALYCNHETVEEAINRLRQELADAKRALEQPVLKSEWQRLVEERDQLAAALALLAVKCPTCEGRGVVEHTSLHDGSPMPPDVVEEPCPTCPNSCGWVSKHEARLKAANLLYTVAGLSRFDVPNDERRAMAAVRAYDAALRAEEEGRGQK